MPDAARPAGFLRSIAHRLAGDSIELPDEGRLASFEGASGWLNTTPLTPDGLRGRVVLVDFWTYTCVNWLRTLPYVRAWAAKYADQGLTIVGVHTPEFDFEHDVENVRPRAKEFGVDFPVALDNGYGSGGPSPTTSGRRSTSPTPRVASDTTTSARASTP